MLTNQRALNLNANNMANVKTPGYREQRLIKTTFEEEFLRMQGGKSTSMGSGSLMTAAASQAVSFKPGDLTETGGAYDLAPWRRRLFRHPGRERRVSDPERQFPHGCRRISEPERNRKAHGRKNGPVRPGNEGFQVDEQGTFRNGKGDILGTLRIVMPDIPENMQFYENGMFQAGNAQLLPVNTAVIQGSLEGSNVDLSAEMTRTMEIQRAFQSCSKALTIIDQMNQKTVSEIGKI